MNFLDQMVSKPQARLRVLLPAPQNELLMQELARRFAYEESDITRRVVEANAFFRSRRGHSAQSIEVRFRQTLPLYSFYLFEAGGVFALFHQLAPKEEPLPTIQLDRRGEFYAYLRSQFDALYKDARVSQ